ncbi:S8 family serine peptidase [Micromonospora sp. WMMA1363]|uniref:S8 family serine peptidase n=1 Tax=Micromonospora sp. WMMA1363 TaxID=3053985 RepID=UPI00259D071E|nr:S8 family serine peptidase [Micromonospora sp. WMMA1363]MDM4721014.1 S8 family serine peptidase [Micromonospora sp. WMMA1363]
MFVRPPARSRLWRTAVALGALVLGLTAQPAFAASPPGTPDRAAVAPGLLDATGDSTFLVYLRETAPLADTAKLPDADGRARAVHQLLTATAERTQRDLRKLLDARKAEHTSYWIANAIRVRGDRTLIDELARRPEVSRIEPTRGYPLVRPTPAQVTRARTAAVEWGLTDIGAPRVWDEFGDRGEGVVVANIDSGVQYDHPALVRSYRGNLGGGFDHAYNWFDPAGVCPDPVPCDNNDHGTHVMGTMVGDDGAGNQTGVAPGARWIAAKGCEFNTCSDASLLAAGQWVLAPTDLNGQNPRPDLRPDIVNNSWGGAGGNPWYQQTVAAWRAAGILPVFSAGNSGPACGSAGSPGDYPTSYAVGAYGSNGAIASFSGRGSGTDPLKPNVAAPGVAVRSSVPGGGYAAFNGTSMAAPHVSGTAALVWSAAPSLRGDVAATEALLDRTARDVDATTCGGTPADNNVFGEGRLDAYEAVRTAPRGSVGRITGTVTSAADGDPIAGATVGDGTRTVTTGADGRYALTVPAGETTVTVTAYGFAGQSATVTVTEGGAVTRDFALVASPVVTLGGRVTDGSGHGWPLYATVDVAGRPGGPVFTDPVTGRWSVTVAGDATYRITVTARYPGYRTVTREVPVGGDAVPVDVAVPVDAACTAAGYTGSLGAPLLSESFDGTSAPAGWSRVNRTDKGGWVFDDPGGRGNLTGGSGGFAIIDSDALGSGNSQDTDLVTPAVDLSGAPAPVLRFRSDWRAVGVSDTADIDVSTDGGATWANVWHQTSSRRGPRVEEVPLTVAGGASDVRVRFRFQGTFAWWWEVDDVALVNRECTPTPGGLVVGTTTDRNTGAPVNGVTVTSVDRPADTGVSAATPEDPNEPDGFYWLFSGLTGTHPFTATRTPYPPTTRDVTVVADDVRRADLALAAGRLTVTPAEVESHQPYGSTRKTRLTVTNTGSAPATVEVLERAGRFELLDKRGAPLREVTLKGISKARTGTAYGGPTPDAGTSADDAWTRVADLPTAVFDNAAASLDGRVYSVGGGSGTGTEGKAWVYDPDTDAWSALPDLPTVRAKPAVAAVGGKLYAFGGWSAGGNPVASVDVLDPGAGTWSTLPGVTNPTPVAAAGTAVAGGKVYLVGGCTDGACAATDRLVVFDPRSGAFTTGAPYPHPVSWLSCGGIGAQVYCAGGTGGTEYTDAYRYDPAADAWTRIADLPLEMWASQYAAAGGMLVLAGGVTSGSTVVTNRTVGYDPTTGSWVDLPNTEFSRYRGAAACGAYRIGGSPTSFVGSVESERLGGLEQCTEEADLPWLSTSPSSFTLAPGASRTVTVTLAATAAAGVAQPGRYSGELAFAADVPYPVPPVSVEMNVSPPAKWGKLQGTVTGVTCGGVTVGVPATVRVNRVGGDTGYTLTADTAGRYAWWLPRGRYDVIVAKDGWIPEVHRIRVQAGFVGTLDVSLEPSSDCTRATGI